MLSVFQHVSLSEDTQYFTHAVASFLYREGRGARLGWQEGRTGILLFSWLGADFAQSSIHPSITQSSFRIEANDAPAQDVRTSSAVAHVQYSKEASRSTPRADGLRSRNSNRHHRRVFAARLGAGLIKLPPREGGKGSRGSADNEEPAISCTLDVPHQRSSRRIDRRPWLCSGEKTSGWPNHRGRPDKSLSIASD